MRLRTLAVLTVLAVAGCDTPANLPDASGTPGSTTVPFALATHCGIDDVLFQGQHYNAVTPLSDGNGNPPNGWDDPTQSGVMRVVSPSEVEFSDAAGHVVRFRLRPQATAAKELCL
jgi:hypothetical protein